MSRCILPSQITATVVKTAMTSTPQTTFSSGSSFGFSPHEDHSAAVCHIDVMISLWSLTVTSTEWLLVSAICNQLPDLVDRHAAWQKALDRVRSFEARQSRHQAVLSLECDKETCKQLRHLHLHRYIVATLKASFITIRQYNVARAKTSIATGINAAIRRFCAERDLCAAPLDAILAKIKHCEIVHDNLSHTMSPACLPRSSAQVMTPPSPTTTTPSSPPSHTHPTSYLGAVLSPKRGTASRRCKSSRRQRLTSWPPSRSIGRLANTNGLVAALVVATYLGRPIHQMRPFPPTLNQQWGGLQRRLCLISRRCKRMIRLLVRIYLPPSNPSPSKVTLQLTRGGGFQ
jgi:hypothetical protein